MSTPLWMPRSDLAARLLGLGTGATGLALLDWQVAGTLRRLAASEPNVTYSLTLILFGELFVVLGLIWVARGLAGYELVRNFQRRPDARKVVVALAVVVGGLSWWFMVNQLARYGYESQ